MLPEDKHRDPSVESEFRPPKIRRVFDLREDGSLVAPEVEYELHSDEPLEAGELAERRLGR